MGCSSCTISGVPSDELKEGWSQGCTKCASQILRTTREKRNVRSEGEVTSSAGAAASVIGPTAAINMPMKVLGYGGGVSR